MAWRSSRCDVPKWTIPNLQSDRFSFLQHMQPVANKTAYVTGANGFLATNVVEQLLLDGWDVVATHRKFKIEI